MHKIAIPEEIMTRVKAARGNIHPFAELTGPTTALVVVDLQNAFMLPGMPGAVPTANEIVPNVNKLAKAVRSAGGMVVWIKMTLEGEEEKWSVFIDYFTHPDDRLAVLKTLSRDHIGHQIHAGLDVAAGDLTLEKTRFSAFVPGSSDLDRVLREHGIDTVIITGTVTNTCCECTARDAMMLNYKMVFVSDGNAARSDEDHNATLANMLRIFGDVLTTDEVIGRLVLAAEPKAAAARR